MLLWRHCNLALIGQNEVTWRLRVRSLVMASSEIACAIYCSGGLSGIKRTC